METKIELEVVTNQLQAALNELKRKRLDRNLIHDYITEALSKVKKLNEPAVSKSEGFEREPAVCPKCGNTGRCEPRTLSDPDGQECDCGAS